MSGNEIVPRGASEEDAAAVAEFERELFKRGTLEFHVDEYLGEQEHFITHFQESLQEEGWNSDFVAGLIGSARDDIPHHLMWQQHFSEQVPKDWSIWTIAWNDIRKAGTRGIQLNSTLIDAGVSYPEFIVAVEAGKTQRLNETQLAILLARPDIYDHRREEVLSAQRAMGVSEEVIQEATRIAKEIQDRIREKKRDKPQIGGTQSSE